MNPTSTKIALVAAGFFAGVLPMAGYHLKFLKDLKALNDKYHTQSQESMKDTIRIFEQELAKENISEKNRQYLIESIEKLKGHLD